MLLALNLIRTDGGTQSRAELTEATYLDYADAMMAGDTFPPLTVFFDGTDNWLGDGFHRYFGAEHAGLEAVEVDQRTGTRRDAVKFSLGANGKHGMQRTHADKRKAVLTALNDAEWSQLPHREIAEMCGVSREYVSRLASELELSCDRSQDGKRQVTRGGTTYSQDTKNIGKAPKASSPVTAPAPSPAPVSVPALTDPGPAAPPPAPAEPPAQSVSEEEAAAFSDDVDPAAELEAAQREIAELKAVIAADDKAAEAEKWRQMYMVAGQRQGDLATDLSKSNRKLFITGEALKKIAKAVGRDDPGARKHDVDLLVRAVQALARQGADA